MRILIVGPAYPFRGGGITTFNERLCTELQQQGHECEILSFSLQYPSFLFPGKTQYSTEKAPEGVKVRSLINSVNPFNWIKVGRLIRKEKYDLVVYRYWISFMAPAFGTIARIIKKNKHTRIVALTDNVIPHEKRFFDKAFTYWFLSVCDGFLTMSHSVLSDLKQVGLNKPAVYTPHPMYDMFGAKKSKEAAREQLGLSAGGRYLLFFGFIRKYKGLHLLLDAFADPRLKELDIKLIVAGEFYEDPKPYHEQVAALGLQNSVIMNNDFIPNGEVADYFCAADAVIQTYLNATQSGVTQIAYYYNKPMIVTNVGGLAELVPDEKVGYVVKTDPVAIADAILRFYKEDKETTFASHIETEKQRFTWETLCRHLLSVAHVS